MTKNMVFRESSSSVRVFGKSQAWRWIRATGILPLLLGGWLFPNAALGLGLGRLAGEAVLGEPLQLAIPLTGTAGAPPDSDCVSLRRPLDSVDAEYFPRDLHSRIERREGSSVLLLSTRSALRQPLVEFRVHISCGYNLAHDYLLMASPRSSVSAAAPPAATVAVPAEPPRAPLPSVDGRGLPDGVPGKVFLVERSLTLDELARLHFPGPLRRERFARWVVEANPQLFAGVRDVLGHRFEPGQQVLIPAGVPPRRPGDHQARPTPAGGDGAAPPPVAARPPQAAVGGGGKVREESRQGRLVIGSAGGTARDLQETLALVDRLTGMLELQVVAQKANDERIQVLEATVAELTKALSQVETGVRREETQRQAELLAMRRTIAEQSQQGWVNLVVAVLAGGLAGAGLLQGLRRFRRREQTAPVIEVPAAPLAPVPGAPSPAAEPLAPWAVPKGTVPAIPVVAPVPPPVERPRTPAARDVPPPRAPAARIDFVPPAPEAPAPAPRPIVDLEPGISDPAAQAIELANVMVSMGLANSAASTLVKHIQENPRQSLFQWLKLLELHRANGNREQFEASAQEMSQHFNVQPANWTGAEASAGRQSLEAYAHLRTQLLALWGTPACVDFLQHLLLDNRDGTRLGFPLPVVEEILLMMAIHDVRR